ncbi:hypothetical protein SAMN00120144_0908 [Hymenobacter roseosalivarius DSM 11622]|uniref:DUF8201 domain-containing protein n=1 Tax=Hymenobacter roseosalivarius DSM 11622 TaxID=645990 RepID=A0A1W1V7A7_9BACT|nr:hypothetical protein [Hymenobacter roseosalivarius]SMB89317.1 hypothetical protein SAMN00120144_0908 [Hymenobacter roseosalivarius DSM 11622]
MLTLLLSWVITAIVTTTVGRAAWAWLRSRGLPGTENPLPLEWLSLLGLCVLAPIVGGISLSWAISPNIQLIVIVSVLALMLAQRKEIATDFRQSCRAFLQPPNRYLFLTGLVILGVLGIRLLHQSTLVPANFDSGLYHFQTLKWLNEYPTVPGLGNLHGRLAFNSSWFPLLSLFRYDSPLGPVYGLGGFLYGLLLVALVRATTGARCGSREAWALPLLFFLLLWSFQIWLSSPAPDCVLPVLLIFAFLRYARKWELGHGHRFDTDTVVVGLVILLAVTIKLSALPALLLPLHSLWASRRAMVSRHWSVVVGLVFCMLTPWLVRGILLSGYLLYPVAALDWISVDWKIPLASVQKEQYMIMNIGQWTTHYTCLPPYQTVVEWVPHWWLTQSSFMRGVMLLAAGSVVPAVVRWRKLPSHELGSAAGWLTAWLGCFFWFWAAPDYRFGVGFLLVAGLWPWLGLAPTQPRSRTVAWLPVLLTLAWGLHALCDPLYQLRTQPQSFARRLLWPAPAPAVPTLLLKPSKGLVVRVPQVGIQCWNAPLPCATCPEIELEMRGATLAQGFRPPPTPTGRMCCLEAPD